MKVRTFGERERIKIVSQIGTFINKKIDINLFRGIYIYIYRNEYEMNICIYKYIYIYIYIYIFIFIYLYT